MFPSHETGTESRESESGRVVWLRRCRRRWDGLSHEKLHHAAWPILAPAPAPAPAPSMARHHLLNETSPLLEGEEVVLRHPLNSAHPVSSFFEILHGHPQAAAQTSQRSTVESTPPAQPHGRPGVCLVPSGANLVLCPPSVVQVRHAGGWVRLRRGHGEHSGV